MIEEISTAVTTAELVTKVAQKVSKLKRFFNYLRHPVKIAVFGYSGSGKTCFLNVLQGKMYYGGTTRETKTIKFCLSNGRRVVFYDCPGQTSYKIERQTVKEKIMQGKFHAIINVVCYGYNETENQGVTIFDSGSNTVKAQYLKDNLKLELEQLSQWVNDITAHSKIKWILTLVNKMDVWYDDQKEAIEYYQKGEYAQCFKGIERLCNLHVISYCSLIAPFGGKPMKLSISEKEKLQKQRELIENIQNFISNV
jgi:GTP-binding protein EngB required for normal cell division